jgi:hypothetical protein
MFEAPKQQVPSSKAGLWVGIGIIVVVAAGFYFYLSSKSGSTASPAATPTSSAAAATAGPANPEQDLRVVSAKMSKDPSGTTAEWLVDIRNLSPVYTYSALKYQTNYMSASNQVVATNTGTINVTLTPGDEETPQFPDILYPEGTAWYQVRITGATSTKR